MTTQTEIDELIAEIEEWDRELYIRDLENCTRSIANSEASRRRAVIAKNEELLTELLESRK